MAINKVTTGWQVDIQPGGRGAKRLKKTFKTKAEALAWERHVRASVQENPEWMPPKKDPRHLSELIELWFRHHGSGLRAGEDTYRRLLAACEAMGNPLADSFSADVFAEYRAERLEDGISQNNMNREHAYLRAVFNELIRLDHWKKENPLKKLRAFKIQERELAYLLPEQIALLLQTQDEMSHPHLKLITKICLATGARWSEAESLRATQVRNGMIQYTQTKSSKARAVPITDALERAVCEHYRVHGNGERVFAQAYVAFRESIRKAKIETPAGQLTHILRHTFASYFMMNGGNILALQKALGHHSLTMTMRYAHLSPDHLAETRLLNPLTSLKLG